MSLFDVLVDEALKNKQELTPLRVVVEKELLHHDILRVLSGAGLLTQLTFIGGTCLRACYGSSRLSEDLDFTGGADFTRAQLADMADVLVQSLKVKYGLDITVAEPVRDVGNVDTWKLKVQTRPGRKDIPAQRINIDVCAIPSYQPRPMVLLNPYGVEMGTSGLILQAQSREEIFADKLVAFALRPNRLKNRDLWDIAWLHQLQVKPAFELIKNKLHDHHTEAQAYLDAFSKRAASLKNDPAIAKEFRNEMSRFLPNNIVKDTVLSESFWQYLSNLLDDYRQQLHQVLTGTTSPAPFKM
ncbi:MAG: nucleotidyl transferase AbiEii/AbiGii toxin family protein [Rhodoferax sp.]|nr:nucleotidyl transferase AbiEii/AbiGii toxin family protein [Rhodoferax sp.]